MSRAAEWLTRLMMGVAIVAVATAIGSCVSERSTSAVEASACNVQLPAEAIGSTIVSVRDFAFTPTQINVRTGAKVTWVNCGTSSGASHTSTSDNGVWASPLLAPGETFTREFDAPGSFPFHCEPHPFMTGAVTVN